MITNETILKRIRQLTAYAEANGLIDPLDRIYAHNTLISALGLDAYEDIPCEEEISLEEILSDINDFAFENGLIPDNGVTNRDLFDAKIMGLLTPRPSEVIAKFRDRSADPASQYAAIDAVCRRKRFLAEN